MSTMQTPYSHRETSSTVMSSEIPVKSYLSSNINRYPELPTYTGTFTSDQLFYPQRAESDIRHRSDTKPSDGIAAAAAMAAVSKQSSASEGPPSTTPITLNKYRSRQSPLTPPMSPTKHSESYLRSPTKSAWPLEKYFTSPRSPPSPPKQEVHAQEPASKYHIDSNNIVFPKTLRHQQEPEMPRTETPSKYGFLRRSLTLKRQSPPLLPREESSPSEPASTCHMANNNIAFPKTLRNQQEQEVFHAEALPARQVEAPPSKPGFFRRSLTLKRQQPPSASREDLHVSDVAPKYHTESNNILFPKTLRQPLQEQEKYTAGVSTKDMSPSPSLGHQPLKSETSTTKTSTPKHPLFSDRFSRPSQLESQGSEPRSLFRRRTQRTEMKQRIPVSRSPDEPQSVRPVVGKHTGLANKTLRRSKTQHRPEPKTQSPAVDNMPLSSKILRPPFNERGMRSRTSIRSSPRETPRIRSMAETMPSSYDNFRICDSGPRKTVRTDVRTSQLPAVTHEHIRPLTHHVNTKEYTREIHNHDVFNRVLPVRDTEVLPAKHFAPSTTDAEKLVEITAPTEKRGDAQAPAAPISMDMASNTTCCKDASAKFHSPNDNAVPFPSTKQQYRPAAEIQQPSSRHSLESESGRQLVDETTCTLSDGTVRTVSVWQYQPTMKAPAREVTETITRPPRLDWTMSPTVADESVRGYMSPTPPRTFTNRGDNTGTRMEDLTAQKTAAGSQTTTQKPTYIGRGSSRMHEQEFFHPSVLSEWSRVPKPSPSPGAKTQADMRDGACGVSYEINIRDYRNQIGQPAETVPVTQRPARPSPSRASPRSTNQRSLLSAITSTVVPQNIDHSGTPQPPGTFEDQESASEYSSAASQQPSPSVSTKTAESKINQPKTSAKLLPGGIWHRHSLVIPAGIVKDGHSLMGAGTLMENRENEEEITRHRLKKASKPEADRVKTMENEPPSLQNKHEMEKLTRRRTEERERQSSLNQDIQKLLAAETALNQESADVSRLEKQADKIIEEEDQLEGEIDSSRRRRSSLLMEAESEHQKARALQDFKRDEQNEPGPRVLQAHRRRRSSLLHEADSEHERAIDLEQQKDDVLAHMPQEDAKAREELDTAIEEAMLVDEERQEEVQLQKFLDDEVQKQEHRENMARQWKAPTGEDLQFPARHDQGDDTSGPYSKSLPDTEAQEGQWTKVVKPKSRKDAAKGNGTQKLPSQRQNWSSNQNGQANKKGIATQQKSSSPPKSPLPQVPGKSGSDGNGKSRSWANIVASKPV